MPLPSGLSDQPNHLVNFINSAGDVEGTQWNAFNAKLFIPPRQAQTGGIAQWCDSLVLELRPREALDTCLVAHWRTCLVRWLICRNALKDLDPSGVLKATDAPTASIKIACRCEQSFNFLLLELARGVSVVDRLGAGILGVEEGVTAGLVAAGRR